MAKRTGKTPGDYEVGRGKPPVGSRFKPGESGNPGGKKKGAKSLKTALDRALARTVSAHTPEGRTLRVTKFEGIVEVLIGMGLNKNLTAIRLLIESMKLTGLVEGGADERDRELSAGEQSVVAYVLARAGLDPGEGPEGSSSGAGA